MDQQQPVYEFGPFQLDPRRRLLVRQGRSIPLTPKALELLLVLVERRGQVVEKDELMRRLWPDSFVEEGNLAFNVSNLRKALGDSPHRRDYIVTIPGRGYQFVAPVEPLSGPGVELDLPVEAGETGREAAPVPPVTNVARSGALIAGIAVILAVAAGAGLSMRRGRTSEAAAIALARHFPSVHLAQVTNTGKARLAAISPDGRHVVHVAVEGGRQSLWVRQAGASSSIQIVPPAEVLYRGLTFSPDGNFILYNWHETDRSPSLYRIPMLGGTATKLLDDVDTAVSFSPDGQRFVFARGNPSEAEACLVVADSDGSRERRLACRKRPEVFGLSGAAWSPDGKVIAAPVALHAAPAQGSANPPASSRFRVVLVDASSGEERPLGGRALGRLGFLSWLPDQSGLVVAAAADATELGWAAPRQIWLISYPRGEARRLTNDLNDYHGVSVARDANTLVSVQTEDRSTMWVAPGGDSGAAQEITAAENARDGEAGISWTPDGRLVFASLTSGNWDIWTSNADGTQRRQLTTGPTTDCFPAVSPDGRTIVFASGRSNLLDLWRMDVDGSNPRRLTQGKAVVAAAFLPRGDEVVYSSAAEAGLASWKVPVLGGPSLRLLPEYEMPPAFRIHGVSPDGRWLLGRFPDRTLGAWRSALVPLDGRARLRRLGAFPEPMQWTPDGSGFDYPLTERGITNVWRLPLDGGAPTQVTRFDRDLILQFAWSRDGRTLALTRGSVSANVVMLTGR